VELPIPELDIIAFTSAPSSAALPPNTRKAFGAVQRPEPMALGAASR